MVAVASVLPMYTCRDASGRLEPFEDSNVGVVGRLGRSFPCCRHVVKTTRDTWARRRRSKS